MKVTILEPKGYCSGVSNALRIALKAKQEHPTENVYVLGMLVHNQVVINLLNEKGIITLNGNHYEEINYIPNKSVVVFTAHGHEIELDKIANDKQLIVYDAICPKVKNNLTLIMNETNHNDVIFIGIKNHPESNAALSLGKNIFLYDIHSDFNYSNIKSLSPLVVNQTTLNILEIQKIYKEILKNIPGAHIQDEICNTTRIRQTSLINLDNTVDGIIIIGDKLSSNTNRLFEISRSAHPNIESIMINDVKELDESFYKNKKHIAISSGASTSEVTLNAILEKLSI